MIIDTHCHYNLNPLYGETGTDWLPHWQQAQAHDVTHSIVVGTTLSSSQIAVEICRNQPKLRATIGYHPHTIIETLEAKEEVTDQKMKHWIEGLEKLLENTTNKALIAGIGETGLDYFRLDPTTEAGKKEIELQQALFVKEIALADKHILPLTLHVRDKTEQAYTDVLELIKTNKKSNLPFILHCASGTTDYILKAVEMGAYIGIAGNVTYKNATQIHEIIKVIPKDRILLETDAPYLPPMPHRGKICEPWMIQLTGQYLQETFGISLEQVYVNTFAVFPTLRTK